MCGPSNPLQQFKHQTQVDRTLQQDRLALRHSASQGFRSAAPSSHILDAEFEAFQSGSPLSDIPQFHPQHDLARHGPFAASPVPSWAADFQSMSISSPMPMQAQQSAFAPMSAGDWAADFRQHIAQPAPRAQSYSPSPLAFQQRARSGMSSAFDVYAPTMTDRPLSKGKSAVREDFDDAAFARAFDMVAQENEQEVMQSVEQETYEEPHTFDTAETMEETIEKALKDSIFDPETVLGHVHIDDPASYAASDMDYNGAGLTEHPRPQDEQQREESRGMDISADDDALAATAGELLERVVDNQSDKFQNSQFLGLMRKLRDREVKVDGDKMVETVGLSPYTPKRIATPDSGYDSGPSTPPPQIYAASSFMPTFAEQNVMNDVAMCDIVEDHRWDHWESPYT